MKARGRLHLLAGFTLVEVVIATAILGLLVTGLASSIMLAARAVPDGRRAPSTTLLASQAMDTIASDLFYATAITTAGPTELVFMVADRTGDGLPETIRYAWSGVKGQPLTRQFNGASSTVIQDVQEFQLAYDTRRSPLPRTVTEGSETILAGYTGNGNDYWTDDVRVSSTNFCGQFFTPVLPANAKSWRVTRVRFRARQYGLSYEDAKVQLRLANGSVPGDVVLEERTMPETTLASWYAWKEFSFSNVSGLPPGSSLCLVLAGTSTWHSCETARQPYIGGDPTGYCVTSINGGGSWIAATGYDMLFQVYGAVSVPDPVSYQYVLSDVGCTLRSGGDCQSRLQTSIRVVNEPPVAGP